MLDARKRRGSKPSIRYPASSIFLKEEIMQKLIWVALFTILLSSFALAQTSNERRVSGYVFAAPGRISDSDSTTLHIGGGVEGRVYRGLGVGGEIGFLGPASSLEDSFGIFSANGSYHFANATQSGKLVPFVTGGYSLFFREGTANAVNFGGGVNYWFKDRLGLRVEVRDHVLPEYRTHYWGVRLGLSFR
jgi:hypothetical protein